MRIIDIKTVIGGARVKNGHVEIGDAPGLGLDLDWKEIAKHPYGRGYWIPLYKPGWEKRQEQED